MFEDRKRNRGLVERERLHDGGGCLGATREHLCHGLAHQRRRIVEQHQQRPFGGGAVRIQLMNCRTIIALPAYAT